MRHVTVVSVIVLLALAATAIAAPPPPVKAQAAKNLAQMSVEELEKLKAPPNAKMSMVVKIKPIAIVQQTGVDLVVGDPKFSQHMPGNQLGFNTTMNGWKTFWSVVNQGKNALNQSGWKIKITCELVNVPPGSAQYNYLFPRWCGFNQGEWTWTGGALPAGGSTPQGWPSTFTGFPLSTCYLNEAADPFPRVTATVDSTHVVGEGAQGETNNVYQIDMCMTTQ